MLPLASRYLPLIIIATIPLFLKISGYSSQLHKYMLGPCTLQFSGVVALKFISKFKLDSHYPYLQTAHQCRPLTHCSDCSTL
ncbi:hypothetical protein QBC38DRAFT_492348 [Podospora fimiseda]|uniref:Uncharacterized protein n=1 Tax=Podospora fimiseda TaxID=252190 RepID=A0AAN6YMV1_9PEZI|nr:hypothetical protein QBC38DRAFT_492348 [Podospora fimiseda]